MVIVDDNLEIKLEKISTRGDKRCMQRLDECSLTHTVTNGEHTYTAKSSRIPPGFSGKPHMEMVGDSKANRIIDNHTNNQRTNNFDVRNGIQDVSIEKTNSRCRPPPGFKQL